MALEGFLQGSVVNRLNLRLYANEQAVEEIIEKKTRLSTNEKKKANHVKRTGAEREFDNFEKDAATNRL